MEHYSHAVSAVLSAVTFLETLVNEIFQDAADGQYRRLGSLSQQATDIMKEFWNASEAGGRHVSVLDKFQLALLFAGKARFEPGGALYQNASLLIYVRNRLVHFRPQTVTHGEQMGEERRLRGKFADNALMANMRNPWFPSKCIGAGCAEWSWKSSLAFANEWIDRLGVTRVFESDLESYPEP